MVIFAKLTAQVVAERLHLTQFDKSGQPYVGHLAAVVGILLRRWPDASPAEIEAAWLHDVLEDTDATPATLEAEGVSVEAIRIVQALTRPPGLSYRAWIAGLADSGDPSVLRIKLADNEHNSDPRRRLPDSNIVERRYAPAKAVLEQALVSKRHGG